jgi:hypothetical protein
VISVGALTPILVCFHKLEITPPSIFNHSRDGTGDGRGREYTALDLRNHRWWNLGDSEHMCGGA